MQSTIRQGVASVACLLAAAQATAQPELSCNGFADVVYAGPQVQDFLVPSLAGASVFFTLQGGDGGSATADPLIGSTDFFVGGEGAQAVIGCTIGTGTGELAPGGTIRFIVGDRGQSASGESAAVGGGGGGTGVLYLPPGGDWGIDGVVLAAAGGGGGAKAQAPVTGARGVGRDGRADECGGDFYSDPSDGGTGGCNGQGGNGSRGAGGGAFSNGENAVGDSDAEGKQGFPNGGAGGTGGFASPGLDEGDGGWGFGGGASGEGLNGGAGGGYSGGGGGEQGGSSNRGTGGGSFVNATYSTNSSGTLAGFSPVADTGFAQYVIERFISNNQQQSPINVIDNSPVGGSFCGATDSGAWDCGPNIDGADLWYTYTSPIDCAPADITISVTTGDAEIQAYFDGADLNTPSSCRGTSANGVYTDTLDPGESILFRVQSPTGSDFVLEAASAFAAGLPDCNTNGVPDSCDIADGTSVDCNGNGRPDTCDISDGTSQDCDSDGIADECDPSDDCPPPNDDFADALPVLAGTYFYDTTFGTLDGNASCVSSGIDSDIWYEFTAPSDGQLVVRQILPSAFVSLVSVSLFDLAGVELGCNRIDPLGQDASRLVRTMSSGEVVRVRVDGPAQSVGFALTQGDLELTFVPGLTNDRCDGAIAAELGTVYPYDPSQLEYGDQVNASCVQSFDRLDLWFSYTSQNGGATRFSTDEVFSTVAIFDACGGTELVCAASQNGNPPAAELSLSPSQTVLIRVGDDGFLNAGNFIIEEVGPCGPADVNADGSAAPADFTAWLACFNDPMSAPYCGNADVNGDGTVSPADFTAWLAAFQQGCP